MPLKNLSVLVVGLLAVVLEGCEYVHLIPPAVLKQVTPEVAALLNELPNVDRQNKEIVGRLFPHGGLSEARLDEDGVMRDEIRISEGQLMWNGLILVRGDVQVEAKQRGLDMEVSQTDGELALGDRG